METRNPPTGHSTDNARQLGTGEMFIAKVEDGVFYGVLTVGGVEYKEPLPELIGQLPVEKQIYWMRRCIDKLRARAKKVKALERAKAERKLRAAKGVMQEKALADQLKAMGVERVEEPPKLEWVPQTFDTKTGETLPEGNEVQNG